LICGTSRSAANSTLYFSLSAELGYTGEIALKRYFLPAFERA
jgi:hypothetical protein